MSVLELFKENLEKFFEKSTKDDGKILIIDDNTKLIIDSLFVMNDLMKKHIYLVNNFTTKPTKKHDHDCIVMIEPTVSNVKLLTEYISNPMYKSYIICFTSSLYKGYLRRIALADSKKVITNVFELHTNILPFDNNLILCKEENLKTLPLVLKFYPYFIEKVKHIILEHLEGEDYYDKTVTESIEKENLEKMILYKRPTYYDPILVIDRFEDMITPLLSPRTYQSMIFEYCVIDGNNILLGSDSHRLSFYHDEFYRDNRFLSYHDVVENLNACVKKHKLEEKSRDLSTIDGMKKIMLNMGDKILQSKNLAMHVNICDHISKEITTRNITELFDIEEELIDPEPILFGNVILNKVINILEDKKFTNFDKLRIALLFSSRYSKDTDKLNKIYRAVEKLDMSFCSIIKNYVEKINKINTTKLTSSLLKIILLKTERQEYKPKIIELINMIKDNKLDNKLFVKKDDIDRKKEVKISKFIIHIVNGVTCREYLEIEKLNRTNPETQYILSGDKIINFSKFIKMFV